MFTIIQDTREQLPLDFSLFDECLGVEKRALKTGDYNIVGYEDTVFIERKRNTGEFANNVGVDKDRFFRELERAKNIKWKYIVCEFTVSDILAFPKQSGIPKDKWSQLRFNGKALYKMYKEIEEKYGIVFIFCENNLQAAEAIIDICNKVYEYNESGF